jgi:large subunit ribosomal protein L3
MKAALGQKIGMTQILGEDGAVVPVTLIATGTNVVTQLKTEETDGYAAVQIGYGDAKKPAKPQAGHAKKASLETAPRFMREVRGVEFDPETVKPGAKLDLTAFEVGDEVDVTGVSKGKGFAGTIKRHNFMRSRKTHGGNGYVRKPGSIGSMYPQKVFKGKKMAGRMGGVQVTTHDLKVAIIDAENGVLGVRGAVPGPRRSFVLVKGSK